MHIENSTIHKQNKNQNDNTMQNKTEKVVICITAQSNSKRLIDYGAKVAKDCGGEFHILHVQKGDNIFNNHETLRLLQQLMIYGSHRGGFVHAFCDTDIAASIGAFVQAQGITKVIMGEEPKNPMQSAQSKKKKESQFQKIVSHLPDEAELFIVGKEDELPNVSPTGRKIV